MSAIGFWTWWSGILVVVCALRAIIAPADVFLAICSIVNVTVFVLCLDMRTRRRSAS